ncbi:MAG: cardiolipin synthase [Arenimonas sp.]|uniref:cardiolipin synthase n=1 Tax=Arenimonas sp. TaxID=1872635 RepID=UPI0025C60FC6|nr:cardiolipin synthase [Arenimonas sp.]MBW8367263.1 cardiolipin synthase [Arenimonas sp.]
MSFPDFWPQLMPWVTGIWIAYLVVLAGWIVLQKREPIATLSWLLSLALLPVLGLVIYHFLGPQRIKRQQLRRSRSRASLDDTPPSSLKSSDDCTTIARLGRSATGFPPSSAARLDLLVGGGETYDALIKAIAGATAHLHVEYYIFEPDRTGTQVRDALVAAAGRGVRVRVLLDAIGSSRLNRGFLAPMVAAGVEIAWFHPVRLRWLWRPRMNLRNHRKVVVVDGRIGFTGGINITDDENDHLQSDAFRDLHLRLEGEVVRWLQMAFLEDWHYATGKALRDDKFWPDLPAGDVMAQVLPAGPDSPWEAIHRVQVEAIHQANRRVWLVTPYFVPGEAARMALTSAALRGLDVRVIVPARSDSRVVSAAARSYYDHLLAAGVRVFEYGPRMLHTKALLVDEDLSLIGSANFDHRSFRLNFELSLLMHGRTMASSVEAVLEEDLRHSREVKSDRPAAAFSRRLGEACARLLSPLL